MHSGIATYFWPVPKNLTHFLLVGLLLPVLGGSSICAGQWLQYFILALIEWKD
jgi:hypothetical protein